jgi:predicted dehydrogenase
MAQREIRFGVVGAGWMGREFASAAARWAHLLDLDFRPRIVAVASASERSLTWFRENVPTVELATTDYRDVLGRGDVEAVYVAVPHHLHAAIYGDALRAGKHLLGEKPFGIDLPAFEEIAGAALAHPELLVRCTSQFLFFPGAYQIAQYVREERFGKIIDVEAGIHHSSDLNPLKPINWKRRNATNGEYGCMGDLAMHVLFMPLRFGWMPAQVYALLSKLVTERPDGAGGIAACDTWDNAILACAADGPGGRFPMLLSTKRISPGEANTWFIRIQGMDFSAEFSTKYPKTLRTLSYRAGGTQGREARDLGGASAYPTISGGNFEFGFSDALMQMYAAFCDELAHGGDGMRQPYGCATLEETRLHHRVLTAALESQRTGQAVATQEGYGG